MSAPSTLTARQARQLLEHEQTVAAAAHALDKAKEARAKLRTRLASRAPYGEELKVGGVKVKRSEKTSGRSFSLSRFLAKHKLTKEMRPFVGKPTPYDAWTVKAISEEPAR